jgi:surfeit locus 1 family protein
LDYRVTHRTKFWLVAVASLVLIALGIALGKWQLNRAQYKQGLAQAMQDQANLPVLFSEHGLRFAPDTKDLYRRVQLRGSWMHDATIFWDNRQMGGKNGFIVLTPLRLDRSDAIVLVQRGWVQRNFLDRARVPVVETPPGLVDIQGQVAPFPARRIALGEAESGAIWQNPNLSEYRSRFGDAFANISVRLTSGTADGLLRDWPAPDDGVDKHLGYAFQWFTLSAVVAIYFLWFQIVKRYRHRHAE